MALQIGIGVQQRRDPKTKPSFYLLTCLRHSLQHVSVSRGLSNFRLFLRLFGYRSFKAVEARTLRVVLSGFYDMASVVTRTFLEFDDQHLCRDP